MKTTKVSIKYILILSFILCFTKIDMASYTIKIITKFPYFTWHYDSLGNTIADSLVRNREIKVDIYKTGLIDNLISEKVTNDSGFAVFKFDY
ncbi:MAG: hypothetical protein ACUVRK_13330 [Spirochaetota bacterium]